MSKGCLISPGVVVSLLLAAGCAHEPAFREELPTAVDADGRTIAIIGDLQQTSWFVRLIRHREKTADEQAQLVADLQKRAGDLAALVIVGDLVYTARSQRHWKHLDSLILPFVEQMPVLPAIGNHDYPCYLVQFCRTSAMARGMTDRFPWLRPGQPYAVDAGDLLLVFIDSESHLAEQGGWLRERLSDAADRYRAALIFFHRPPWSNSIDRGAHGDPEVQSHIVPVLRDASLPVVVFNGHIHGYEYIVRDGVPYITTAGGGGPRGPMAAERPFDFYRGPDCPQRDGESMLRPFNYLLLREQSDRLAIEVRGFCRGDAEVRELDSIDIAL